jgi:hypothetical protein
MYITNAMLDAAARGDQMLEDGDGESEYPRQPMRGEGLPGKLKPMT